MRDCTAYLLLKKIVSKTYVFCRFKDIDTYRPYSNDEYCYFYDISRKENDAPVRILYGSDTPVRKITRGGDIPSVRRDVSTNPDALAVYPEPLFNQHHFVWFNKSIGRLKDRQNLKLVNLNLPDDVIRSIVNFIPNTLRGSTDVKQYEYRDIPNFCKFHEATCPFVCDFCGECSGCRYGFQSDPWSKRIDQCDHGGCSMYDKQFYYKFKLMNEVKIRFEQTR